MTTYCVPLAYSHTVFQYAIIDVVLRKERYPLLGTSSSKLEVSLLARINLGGTFSCALKFDHAAVLVDTCDVFLKISEALK